MKPQRSVFTSKRGTQPSANLRLWSVLGTAVLLFAVAFVKARAGTPAGYTEFLVPFDEDVFTYVTDPLVAATVDPIPGNYSTHSVISVTGWSDSITVYWDHWENGYGYDENNPDGSGSDEKFTLNTGQTLNFESPAIPRPRTGADGNTYVGAAGDCLAQAPPVAALFRNTTNFCYDGRDRIFTIGGATTVTRGGWINSPFPAPQLGVRASVGEEVYPLSPQLVKYVLPFGEDAARIDYQRVVVTIQATEDDTVLQIDLDGNGVFDGFNPANGYRTARTTCAPGCLVSSIVLQRGQTYILDRDSDGDLGAGLLLKDTLILGSKTLQVEYFTGQNNAGLYDTRAVSAYPRGFWGTEYYGPVDGATDGNTDVLLYNPNAQAITITWETTTGTGTFSLASEETGFLQAKRGGLATDYVPNGSGIYLRGTAPFWGISDVDTNSGNYDWAYTLVPSYLMTDEQAVAWAPGNVPTQACSAAEGRDGGLFVTAAQDNTTFFIDKNGDGVGDVDASMQVLMGGTLVAATGTGYKANRLESLYITGSNSGTTAGDLCDLTGAQIIATGPFAMAYGENPDPADAALGTDLGYTALPSPGNWMDLVLTVDKATSPVLVSTVAGVTTVTYTLVVDSQLFNVDSLTVLDTLPANWTYDNDSTTITLPNLTQITGPTANPTVALPNLTWGPGTLGSLLPNQRITITFTARTTAVFATGALTRNKVQAIGTRTVGGVTQTFNARDFVFNTYASSSLNMELTKTSSVPVTTPVSPGDTLTYTVALTNPAGTATTLTGISLNDILPVGVTSVAGTTTLSRSSVADAFGTNAYTNSNGTRAWATNWTETVEATSATAGDIQVAGGELRLNNDLSAEPTVLRRANLAGATSALLSFRYRTGAGVDAGDSVTVCGRRQNTDGWTCPLTGGTFTGITGATSGSYSVNLSTLGTLTATAEISFQFAANTYTDTVASNESFFVDDLSITYDVSVTGANPPELLSKAALYALSTNQSLTATFNVTVNTPFPTNTDEIVNLVYGASSEIPIPLTATARNIVLVPGGGSGTVGDRVWLDTDGDGAFDPGETGLSGVEVTLKDQFGTPLQVTTTNSQGLYTFIDVSAGSGYFVEITGGMPAGFTSTFGDSFTTGGGFSGNTGTATWLTDWTENNDDASPTGGDIQIANDRLEFRDGTDGGTPALGESIQRSATVTGANSLELKYTWDSLLTNTFGDTFPTNAFTNNTGTLNFATNWAELNDDAAATTGELRIANGRIEIGGAGLTPEAGDGYQRTATVTGATSLTLRYSWASLGLETDNSDNVLVQYSTDGTAWTTSRIIRGDLAASYTEVIPWTPTDTTAYVRFVTEDAIEAGEAAYIDNVSLEMNGADDILVEYSSDGTTWTTSRTLSNAVAAGTYTDTIPWTSTDATAFVRFRAEDALETGEQARINDVLLTMVTGGGLTQTTDTVRDAFDISGVFTGSVGTLNWLTPWSETGDGVTGATSGDLQIVNNHIEFGGAGSEAGDALQRSATVTGATSIEVQYSWNQVGVGADDDTLVQYSTDGSAWTTLRRLDDGTENAAGNYTETIPWTPTNSTFFLRFVAEDDLEASEVGIVDNVQVRFVQSLRTQNFNLVAGQDYVQADLGFRANAGTASIGDLVWVDADNDQSRDPGEVGLSDITVQLFADDGRSGGTAGDGVPDGTAIQTQVTGAGGAYLFTGIPANGANDYVVTMSSAQLSALTTAGYTATTNTLFAFLDLPSGVVRVDADFGFMSTATCPGVSCVTGTIIDGVWLDNGLPTGTANNGTKDGTEVGIAGVTLDLLNSAGATIASTTTDSSGLFQFTGVPIGQNYTWRITDQAQILSDYYGTSASALSGNFQMGPPTPTLTSAGLDYTSTPHFGYNQTRTIGDTVFNDINNNLSQGAGEPGISGVTVLLYKDNAVLGTFEPGAADGAPFATTVTDANGKYLFAGLPSGFAWWVSIDGTQSALSPFTRTTADNSGVAGDQRLVATLSGANNDLTKDYGYRATTPLTISGLFFSDINRNGGNDAEAGFQSVTVDLLNSNGTVIATTSTAADGTYSFPGLPAATYTVRPSDVNGILSGTETTREKAEGALATSGYNGQETVTLVAANVTDVDFGFYRGNAIALVTRAVIGSFAARDVQGAVSIEWTTVSEVGTLGFHLKRWDDEKSDYVPVNRRLIRSLITSPHGGEYRYIDRDAVPGRPYRYLLVEVEKTGGRLRYGPYDVDTRSIPADPELSLSTEDDPNPAETDALLLEKGESRRPRREHARNGRKLSKDPSDRDRRGTMLHRPMAPSANIGVPQPPPAASAKIGVPVTGVYYVSLEDLRVQGGVVPPANWLSSYALTNRGHKVAFAHSPDLNGFLFYGRATESNVERENVYRLSVGGGGSRMKSRQNTEAPPPSGAETFAKTLHVEKNVTEANNVFSDPDGDFWIWNYVFPGYYACPEDCAPSFTFRADGAAGTGEASVTIRLKGGTEMTPGPDHHPTFSLNGRPIGDAIFNGFDNLETTIYFDPGLLLDGENEITVDGLPTAAEYNVFYVDSFDVNYSSRYRATGNRVEAPAAGNAAILMSGFTRPDIAVFDITNPNQPVVVRAPVSLSGDGTYGVVVASRDRAALYYATTPDGVVNATRILPDTPSALRSKHNSAEHVIITTQALKETAKTLADYRSELGSQVVDVEDIYDEFNFGIASPHAVKAFLTYARANWSTRPRYVVLAGDGTYDYKNFKGLSDEDDDNLIPTRLANTPYGMFPSDQWFVERATSKTEIAIGRLPVTTSAELAEVIRKIEARETALALDEPWLRKTLLLADNPDDAGDFHLSSEGAAAYVPADAPLARAYLSTGGGAEPSRSQLLSGINDGTGVIGYIGHSGFDVFADEELLTMADVAAFTNADQPTVMTAMTCDAGNAAQPGRSNIGESLLRQEGGGVAAFWSASGLSENHLADPLVSGFYQALFSTEGQRIGDTVNAARKSYKALDLPLYMLSIYNLLGDPAMKVR